METSGAVDEREIRELPIVSDHLAVNFANTIDDPDGPGRHDHIGTYPELLQWSIRLGILSSAEADHLHQAVQPRAAGAALAQAHALRAALMATFTDIATGEPAVGRYWADLRPFVIDAIAHAELVSGDVTSDWTWPDKGQAHAMLWPVAHAAAGLLTAPELHRLKRCAGCPWVFIDQSRNNSRRWCAMSDCGTHAKIRRYVARRAARRGTTA